MTLRSHPRMVSISPKVDISEGTLSLSCRDVPEDVTIKIASLSTPGCQNPSPDEKQLPVDAPVRRDDTNERSDAGGMRGTPVRLCGKTIWCKGIHDDSSGGDTLSRWLRRALSVDCTLVRIVSTLKGESDGHEDADRRRKPSESMASDCSQQEGAASGAAAIVSDSSSVDHPSSHGEKETEASSHEDPNLCTYQRPGGFTNEGGLLVVSTASLHDLANKLTTNDASVDPVRFRVNLVVLPAAPSPFVEDQWSGFFIGRHRFLVRKKCKRCDAIQVDPETGKKGSSGVLRTLAQYRRSKGRIDFGVICDLAPESCTVWIHAGDVVEAEHI